MKKLFLIILLITHTSLIRPLPPAEIRTQGLVYCGLLLCAGGTYKLAKQSETKLLWVTDTVQGLLLLASGILTIVLSGQVIHEIDNCFK